MQTFTYEEIREKALKQGVTDNRLRVGLWASSNGYIKSKRKIQGKVYTIYFAPVSYTHLTLPTICSV